MRIKLEPVASLTPHPTNPRRDHDVATIAESIRAFGWRQPVVVYDGDGHVLAGHGRLLAARELGLERVPVHHVAADELTPTQAAAYRLADNRAAEGSSWDDALLLAELELLGERERQQAGFDAAYLEELRRRVEFDGADDMAEEEAGQTLAERFGAPPFSVLDARQGWWQDRKRAWVALGIQSELGRTGNLQGLSEQSEQYRRNEGAYGKNANAAIVNQDKLRAPAASRRLVARRLAAAGRELRQDEGLAATAAAGRSSDD